MKFLVFWAAVIAAIYYFSKKKKNTLQSSQSQRQAPNSSAHYSGRADQAQTPDHHSSAIIMVECAHCKTHFPNYESIDFMGETFCSVEHKNLGRR